MCNGGDAPTGYVCVWRKLANPHVQIDTDADVAIPKCLLACYNRSTRGPTVGLGDQANAGEVAVEDAAAAVVVASAAASYMDTHDLVYAKDAKRHKVKTHREVEVVLGIHCWTPTSAAPVNGWMDYCYEPAAGAAGEIKPLASLPAPCLTSKDNSDPTPRWCPSPDDWKLAFFQASLDCVRQFAARVNTVTGDEILIVEEKPYHWLWAKVEEEALRQRQLYPQ